ncbi:MAG TPA: GFA family protein [Nevskiaceae bacterium]|nr:GFA family protein [Nevskiaceae bacterium]
MDKVTHRGGCHCGAVRFEVRAPARVTVQHCNCSMCSKTAFVHLIVPKTDFRLVAGAEQLALYTFNTGVAQHLFCKVCGVKSFYIPRSNPDGFSVNLRCFDDGTLEQVNYENFDGQNWEAHGAKLAHLSQGGGA